MAHGILVPQPGLKLAAPVEESWNLNSWSTREVPLGYFLKPKKTYLAPSLWGPAWPGCKFIPSFNKYLLSIFLSQCIPIPGYSNEGDKISAFMEFMFLFNKTSTY